MRGRYTEYDNVEDFISHKLARLIHEMQKVQRADIVKVLQDALIAYEDGDIEVSFVNGWPHALQNPKEESDMSD